MPLPPLGRTKAVIDTADVLIEGTLYYAAANKVLEKRVTGKSIGSGWRRVKIESIVARPGGQGRMLLGVTISGAADGTVYVVGTPHYDSVAKLITVPDLAFDVKSQGYLESAAGWLINGPLLDEVRDEAKLPVQDLLDELVRIVNKEINRPLAEGIYLRGALSDAHALSVRAVQRGVIVDAKGLGRLWLEVDKRDLLPKKRLIKQPKKALATKRTGQGRPRPTAARRSSRAQPGSAAGALHAQDGALPRPDELDASPGRHADWALDHVRGLEELAEARPAIGVPVHVPPGVPGPHHRDGQPAVVQRPQDERHAEDQDQRAAGLGARSARHLIAHAPAPAARSRWANPAAASPPWVQ